MSIKKWLLPVSFLYGIGVRIRNKLFDWNILKEQEFPIPIISIGNLTVGGTGKTPHTEYLINHLKQDYNVAVLSRGYKRKSKGFVLANESSTVRTIGDEPYQIKQKFPEITVAVDANRRRGIKKLLKVDNPKIDIILLDDAFQHRYVKAGISILLIDYSRPICEDKLLPAGLLREPLSSKYRGNIVIVSKCKHNIKPIDFNIVAKRLALYPFQKLYFSNFKYGNLTPLFPNMESKEGSIKLSELAQFDRVLLLSGIANPKPLKEKIERINKKVELLKYPDHHNFTKEDIATIENKFKQLNGDNKIIITTEKDATRLLENPYINEVTKSKIFYLPINVSILQNKENELLKNILDYVRENKRDC